MKPRQPLTRPKPPRSTRGGIWTCDATVTYRRELERYIDYLEAQIAHLTQPAAPVASPMHCRGRLSNTQTTLWEE